MNDRHSAIIQAVVWLTLIVSPLMFMNHGQGITMRDWAFSAAMPLSLMIVFYANYLWLAPRYMAKGSVVRFIALNAAMIAAAAIALHLWMELTMPFISHRPPHPAHEPGRLMQLLFTLRSVFYLSLSAIGATALYLALRWQRAETERRKAEAARMDAELKTLRAQINPHFLLNTLAGIHALTAIDATRAQDAIERLSRMLRHALYDSQQPQVALADEIDFLTNYVALMKMRLTSRVRVETSFPTDEAIAGRQVAPMIFLCLVENAFKHGVAATGDSHISISIATGDGSITFHAANTNRPKAQTDRSGHGLGLAQVAKRLEMIYKGRYLWDKHVEADTYHSTLTIYDNPMRRN